MTPSPVPSDPGLKLRGRHPEQKEALLTACQTFGKPLTMALARVPVRLVSNAEVRLLRHPHAARAAFTCDKPHPAAPPGRITDRE